MRSGVDYEERYDFENPGTAASNHIAALVRNTARFVDVARTLRESILRASFSSTRRIDTAVLGWLVERVTQGSVARLYRALPVGAPRSRVGRLLHHGRSAGHGA